MEKYDDEKGVWRTIRGRRIFIASGQSLGEAMAKSGKFNRTDIREGKREASLEDRIKKSRNIAKKTNEKNFGNSRRKLDKNEHKYASKYDYRDSDFKNQDRKNRINEKENIINRGARRVDKNAMRYSKRDEQELRHEELQKKLADYKAKKQSNNRVVENTKTGERYKELNNGQWRSEKDGYDYYLDMNSKNKDNSQYKEVKQSNNKPYSVYNKTMTDKVFDKSQYRVGDYATEEEAFREIDRQKNIDKSLGIDNDYEIEQSNNKVESQDMPHERDLQDVVKSLNDEGSDFSWNINEYKDGKASLNVGVFMPDERGYVDRDVEFDLKGIKGNTAEGYSQIEDKIREWQDKHSSPDTFYDDDFEDKAKKQETIKNYAEKKKSNNAQTTNRILERSGKVNQKTLKSYADDGLATDITRYSDKDIDKLEKKHGRLTHLKTSMGTYGMNGALLKGEKTGEYFVITSRNGNLFRLV